MGAVTDIVSAGMQKQYLDYQSAVQKQMAPLNQSFYNVSAQSALDAGKAAEFRTQVKASQVAGAQTAGFAASGVDTTSGSAQDAMASSRMMATLDEQTQLNNAAREAWGYKVRGVQAFEQGMIDSEKSSNDANGTALGGFGKAFSDIGTKI